jgi:hypothetical protein
MSTNEMSPIIFACAAAVTVALVYHATTCAVMMQQPQASLYIPIGASNRSLPQKVGDIIVSLTNKIAGKKVTVPKSVGAPAIPTAEFCRTFPGNSECKAVGSAAVAPAFKKSVGAAGIPKGIVPNVQLPKHKYTVGAPVKKMDDATARLPGMMVSEAVGGPAALLNKLKPSSFQSRPKALAPTGTSLIADLLKNVPAKVPPTTSTVQKEFAPASKKPHASAFVKPDASTASLVSPAFVNSAAAAARLSDMQVVSSNTGGNLDPRQTML